MPKAENALGNVPSNKTAAKIMNSTAIRRLTSVQAIRTVKVASTKPSKPPDGSNLPSTTQASSSR